MLLEGCASAGALLRLGCLRGQGAALPKRGRELKVAMYAGASLGACKTVGQKAHLCKLWRLKEEGCFLASLPLSSCCSQRSRSSARTPVRHPPASERALLTRKRRVEIKAIVQQQLCCQAELCSAGNSSQLQNEEPQRLWAAPEGQGAAVTLVLDMLLGVAWLSPQTPLPS